MLMAFSLQGSWAKDEPVKVIINGNPSQLQPVEAGGRLYLPLDFPLDQGKNNYKVTVEYDKVKGTVTVQKQIVRDKVRGDTECSRCSGKGKCQACYPAGSGKNISGDGACSACDGTGKCFYCNGKGSY
jgi:hypothetical protein